jgi:hydrogenase expression/formation protein HypD
MELARRPDVITTTFGDMMRVPGTSGNLEAARAAGADVRMLYSPMKSLDIAAGSPDRTVVFLGVGFETTAPGSALLIRSAAEKKVPNLAVFSAHKLIPPALRALCADPDISVTGFIMPGHVTVVLGPEVYGFIPREFGIPCVVTGFEPGDVLESIGMLLRQLLERKPRVENQYKRVVKPGGNELARKIIDEVFEPADTHWRGFGMIPRTGLAVREKYARFDAERRLDVRVSEEEPDTGCRCGDVVRGKLYPKQCPLFARKCTPATPVGPCMVSSEGACAASYRYERT